MTETELQEEFRSLTPKAKKFQLLADLKDGDEEPEHDKKTQG